MPAASALQLPFTPPNNDVCLALYHPVLNRWDLVFSSFDRRPSYQWTEAIRKTHGSYQEAFITGDTIARNQWHHYQGLAKKLMASGYLRVQGNLKELGPGGAQWLKTDIKHWWYMQSASVAQLNVLKDHPQGSEVIMKTLYYQGFLGDKAGSHGRRGPSVVKHRWQEIFPDEMAFAANCSGLGIGGIDAIQMWKQTQIGVNTNALCVAPEDFASLLDTTDLR